MIKLCYYTCAIGNTHFSLKYRTLLHNLKILSKDFSIDLIICKYDNNIINTEDFDFLNLNGIYIHQSKGILVELWVDNPYNDIALNSDYVFFVLDDIYLYKDFDLLACLKMKNKYAVDIVSPIIENSPYFYFKHNSHVNEFTRMNFLEFFCYIMTPQTFFKYLSVVTVENPSTCGNDLLMYQQGLSVGVCMSSKAVHLIKAKIDLESDRHLNFMKLIGKYGFISYWHVLCTIKSILYEYPLNFKMLEYPTVKIYCKKIVKHWYYHNSLNKIHFNYYETDDDITDIILKSDSSQKIVCFTQPSYIPNIENFINDILTLDSDYFYYSDKCSVWNGGQTYKKYEIEMLNQTDLIYPNKLVYSIYFLDEMVNLREVSDKFGIILEDTSIFNFNGVFESYENYDNVIKNNICSIRNGKEYCGLNSITQHTPLSKKLNHSIYIDYSTFVNSLK